MAKGTQVTNGKSNEVGGDLVEKNEMHRTANTAHNSSNDGATMNGNLSRPELNKNGDTEFTNDNAENEALTSIKVADMEKEQSRENLRKV